MLLCPWDSLGKITGLGCHAFLQGILLTKGSNPGLMSPALAGRFFTTSTTWEACPGGSMVKNLPDMQRRWEIQVQSLGQEGPLEKKMATDCSVLAKKVLRTEEPGGLLSVGSQRVGHN